MTAITWSRAAVIVVTIAAAGLALILKQSLYELVKYAWSGQGASFAPLVLTSLYYKRLNGFAAVLGLFAGAVSSALWPLSSLPFWDLPLVPGFAIGLFSIIFFSELLHKKNI